IMKRLFSEEPGFLTYAILSIFCFIIPLPLFWVSYLCVTAGEYWPLILFGGTIFGSWFSAYGFFCKARNKFLEDRNK
ncbi:MAG: hypothetical protein ACREFE_09905, partial [Limisphaerales bacterium]